ncbi:MSP (Major sperm protein) domain-containing protein [Ditylenchus destructor]|uniref:Major sperm protein n=1 Tax=Ditylenchus destructor TaxID=166010 RepID=A0AAD4NLG4_9BILA|nr:MSP (Major sperm protein) domain-containing protein [Ditylenchus destructor]
MFIFSVGVNFDDPEFHRSASDAEPNPQSIPPSDLKVQPSSKLVFNAPFDSPVTYSIKVSNAGGQRAVGVQVKSSSSRLSVNPAGELLQAGQSSSIAITCKPFNTEGKVGNDTVTVEWSNAPNNVKQFNAAALFPASAAKKHKDITIEYNV